MTLRVDTVAQIALLIPFLVAIPIALLFGFSLSSPDSFFNILIMALCFGVMLLPILIRWHDMLLIASLNMPIMVFFLPGQPQLWMLMVFVSMVMTAVSGGLSRNIDPNASSRKTKGTRGIIWSLVAIVTVVVITALSRGGIGSHAFGSDTYGARKYLPLLFGAMVFFVTSRLNIPANRKWHVVIFYFGGYLLLCMSNLIYMAGPSFYWLFYIFPSDFASAQAFMDNGMGIVRMSGIAFGMMGVVYVMLARYGIKGIMDMKYAWRLIVFVVVAGLSTLGGFRSLLALLAIIFIVQFYYEGLFRTYLFPVFAVIVLLILVGTIAFIGKLPLSVQRTLSFLPVPINAAARESADSSTEWRFRMWKVLWDEVPNYLVLGKGYRIDPSDLALFEWARVTNGGHFEDYEESMAVGNYHSGPFSVLLSFGIPGVLAVLFFWGAGIKMLRENLTRGSPEMRSINITLLSCFVGRVIYFLLVFGDLSGDLPVLCGLLGVSVALNKSEMLRLETA